jgi:hypothetical protein
VAKYQTRHRYADRGRGNLGVNCQITRFANSSEAFGLWATLFVNHIIEQSRQPQH